MFLFYRWKLIGLALILMIAFPLVACAWLRKKELTIRNQFIVVLQKICTKKPSISKGLQAIRLNLEQ